MEVIMADTITNKNTTNAKSRKVVVTLPLNRGQNANQDEFFSVNGKNYIIRRGEEVEIPEEVAEVIRNAEKADAYAMRYVKDLTEKYKEKEKDIT
jgi:hypothetical protein